MPLKDLFWLPVRKSLISYVSRKEAISQCMIRHSSAFGPQDIFLSDLDLTFFVKARSLDELRNISLNIHADLERNILLKGMSKDAIFLPDTKAAYRLCEEAYPFRSRYPISSWIKADAPAYAVPPELKISLPLDLAPESFFYFYMVQALMKQRKRRILEYPFLRRKLLSDQKWTGESTGYSPLSFDETLVMEMKLWDKFYQKTNEGSSFSAQNLKCQLRDFNPSPFMECWKSLSNHQWNNALKSLWVYPTSHNDPVFNVNLNLNLLSSPKDCRNAVEVIAAAFQGLKYALFLGTEEAMVHRINGLRGHFLIDPWLFKHQAHCLYGDSSLRQKIKEPSLAMIKTKFREFLLNLMISSRFLNKSTYPYASYRLCFTMDHLLKNGELVTKEMELLNLYKGTFIKEKVFDPKEHTVKLLQSLKVMHGFDIFGDQ